MDDDWLRVPQARRAGEVLGDPNSGDEDEAESERTIDLLSPEHRDKLVTMVRWVSQGRQWDEVRDEVLAMFDVPGDGTPPR